MKKRIFFITIFLLLCLSCPVYAAGPAEIPGNESTNSKTTEETDPFPTDAPEVTAKSAIVMDIDTGDILYQKDPHKRSEPASTTKLMTAILAADNLNVTDKVTVSAGALDGILSDAVTIGLSPGEEISVLDLFYAMLLPSANDAANVLGMTVSGTMAKFVKAMNQKAAELGCKETHFANANGLPDDNHYTTAYDMAKIAQAAYGRSRIRDVIRTESYWIPATNMVGERELWTTNQMLYDITDVYYEYCTGGKTGYTESAGNTYVGFAEKNGRRLVAVVFGCPGQYDRFDDAKKLLEFAFDNYHRITPLQDFELSIHETEGNPILENYYERLGHALPEFSVDRSVTIYARTTVGADDIKKDVTLFSNRSGEQVGEIVLSYRNSTLATVPILSDQSAMAEDLSKYTVEGRSESKAADITPAPTRSEIIKDVMRQHLPLIIVALLAASGICIITILVVKLRRKNRVVIHRYFGDGPVPARDGKEAIEEHERRKAEKKMLNTIEDEGDVPVIKKRPPRPKPERSEDDASWDEYVDEAPAKKASADRGKNGKKTEKRGKRSDDQNTDSFVDEG